MTNEERRELRTALSVILANISVLQKRTDAAVAVLARNYPAIHAEYEKALVAESTKTSNESASLLEHLDKTLLRYKE
jgi:hypothetical protein